MSAVALHALLITGMLTLLLELLMRHEPRRTGRPIPPRPVLSLGMMAGICVMLLIGEEFYPAMQPMPPQLLYLVLLALFVVMGAGLRSDITRRPSTRRHTYAILAGAVLLFLGGLSVPGVGDRFGVIATVPSSLLLTLTWVFLIAAIIEICALVPFAAGGVAVLTGLGTVLINSAWPTWPGHVLAGVLMGAAIGRALPNLFLAYSRPADKAEVLSLGLVAAAATLAVYIKKVALTGLVFPLGVLLVLFALLLVQSLEGSLMLRSNPREKDPPA